MRGRSHLVLVAFGLLPLLAGAEEGRTRRFTWEPSLEMRVVADDNVRQSARDTDRDLWMVASPRLELGYRASAIDAGADLGAEFRHYTRESDLDDVFYRARAHAETGLWPGLSLRLADTFAPQPQSLGLPEDDAANLQQTNLAEGELRFWHQRDEQREFTLGLRAARFDSEPFAVQVRDPGGSTRVQSDFDADYWDGGSFLELRHAVGRRSSVYVRGRLRYRSFDEARDSDHTLYSTGVGFATHLFSRLRLQLAGGWGLIDYRQRSDVPRFLGNASLRYEGARGWTVEAGAHQRFTSELSGGEFLDTTARLQVEKTLGRRTLAGLTGFLSYLDDEASSPRSNLFGGVELRVIHRLSRRLRLGLSYRYWNNAGAYAADDFQQNRVMATLGYRY